MARTKISEFSATPGNNTDIDGINLAEGCAPSGINDAIRELMSQLKDWQAGTSNDPMTIGSTGSLTLSYGTANGVAYLNGSKVLTTGSALQFDGTKAYNNLTAPPSGWSGIGTSWWVKQSATDGGFYAIASSSDAGIFMGHNGTIGKLGVSYGSTAGYTPLAFFTNDAEQMRLTSTGLGIGTSSPIDKLHIAGGMTSTSIAAPTNTSIGSVQLGYDGTNGVLRTWNSSPLRFDTAGAQRMLIDAAGNLGLGVTPSAWQSGWKALQIGAGGGISDSGGGNFDITNNYYRNSGDFYLANGYATLYRQASGQHRFFTAPNNVSGAGAPISFTQAMTLDASGNLLVGTTTQQGRLTVVGGTGLVQSMHIDHPGGYSAIQVRATDAAFADNVYLGATSRAASSAFQFFRATANGTDQFRVAGNGVIYAQNTTVQSISDQRLKENIQSATDGLDVITALRPVRYDWKEGYGNDRKNQLGFIAQEVEAVFPEAVSEWQVSRDDETVYKTVGPGAFIPVLVKAIQEQQAIITALTARIEVLEAK